MGTAGPPMVSLDGRKKECPAATGSDRYLGRNRCLSKLFSRPAENDPLRGLVGSTTEIHRLPASGGDEGFRAAPPAADRDRWQTRRGYSCPGANGPCLRP